MIVLCWICTFRYKYLPIRARPCVAHHTNSLPQKSLFTNRCGGEPATLAVTAWCFHAAAVKGETTRGQMMKWICHTYRVEVTLSRLRRRERWLLVLRRNLVPENRGWPGHQRPDCSLSGQHPEPKGPCIRRCSNCRSQKAPHFFRKACPQCCPTLAGNLPFRAVRRPLLGTRMQNWCTGPVPLQYTIATFTDMHLLSTIRLRGPALQEAALPDNGRDIPTGCCRTLQSISSPAPRCGTHTSALRTLHTENRTAQSS